MATSSWTSPLRRWLEAFKARRAGRRALARSFDEQRRRQQAFEAVDRGVQEVPVARIVGSVGRYHDFDDRFRPLHHLPGDRLKRIVDKMRQGHRLPPVKLYQIRDEFYVLDGNHRVAAAKQLGLATIRACILEFIPSADTLENVLYREKRSFHQQTGIAPELELTELGQYDVVLRQIEAHRAHLTRTEHRSVSLQQAAADWHRTIYRPLRSIIERGRLLRLFPNRTIDDLYVYISYHQWEKGQKRAYGIGIDRLIPNDMERFRDKMADTDQIRYPEMKREVTAFVLMNIRAKNEMRIIDKLFSLPEVQEVHSVHGDIDLIVKVVLTRDLLVSDAEIIAHFVQDNIRQIHGVLSTQTLIPGYSRIKENKAE